MFSPRYHSASQDGGEPGGATGHGVIGKSPRTAHERAADGGDSQGNDCVFLLPARHLLPVLPST